MQQTKMITVNTIGKSRKEAVEITRSALDKLQAQNQDVQIIVDVMSGVEIKNIMENYGLDVLIEDDGGQMMLIGSAKKIQAEDNDNNVDNNVQDNYNQETENIKNFEQMENKNENIKNIENNLENLENNENNIENMEKTENEERIKIPEQAVKIVKETVAEKIKSEKLKNDKAANDTVFLIMDKALGRSDNKLGGILIKGFLAGLVRSEPAPEAVILLNEGVKLALFDSSTCDHLKDLEARGTQILISGICTSHFGITDNIGVGVIANIYEIVDVINKSGKVVSL